MGKSIVLDLAELLPAYPHEKVSICQCLGNPRIKVLPRAHTVTSTKMNPRNFIVMNYIK